MGSIDVEIARKFYNGNDVHQVAAALAKAEGYHVIIWLKKGGSWENDRLGCCMMTEAVKGYLASEYSIGAEVVYDDGVLAWDDRHKVAASHGIPAENLFSTPTLWQGVPITERTFKERIMQHGSQVRSQVPAAVSIEVYTAWPETVVNVPTFLTPGDVPTCVLRFERTNSLKDGIFRSFHEKRFQLRLECHCFPTYPIVRFVMDFQNPDWRKPFRFEGLPDLSLGDIQGFISDFIQDGRWRLVLGDTSGRFLEASLTVSQDQRSQFLRETEKAVLHYRTIKNDLLDYRVAVTRFMKEVPLE